MSDTLTHTSTADIKRLITKSERATRGDSWDDEHAILLEVTEVLRGMVAEREAQKEVSRAALSLAETLFDWADDIRKDPDTNDLCAALTDAADLLKKMGEATR